MQDGPSNSEARDDSREPQGLRSTPRYRPTKLVLTLTLAPIVALTVAANVGNRLSLAVINSHPLLLLWLNPTKLIMAGASPKLDAFTYFSVVIIRQLCVDPLYFMLGRWYGDSAIRWIARRSPDIGQTISTLERWFPRWGWALIVFYPQVPVILLAGGSKMRLWVFMAYDALGVVSFAIAIRWFGYVAKHQINGVTGFFGKHQLLFTIISAVLLVYYLITLRKQKTGIKDMERELEDADDEPRSRPIDDDKT